MDERRRSAERAAARDDEEGRVRVLVERLRLDEDSGVHCPRCHGCGTCTLADLVEDGGRVDFPRFSAGTEANVHDRQQNLGEKIAEEANAGRVLIVFGPKGPHCRRCHGTGERKLREVLEVLAWAGARTPRLALGLPARRLAFDVWQFGFFGFEHDVPLIVQARVKSVPVDHSTLLLSPVDLLPPGSLYGQIRNDVLWHLEAWACGRVPGKACACGETILPRSTILL